MRSLLCSPVAFLCTVLLVGCGRGANGAEGSLSQDPIDNTADSEATKTAIIARITRAQKRGLEDHDLDAYLAIWTEDARIIDGRGPETGPHDLVLSRSQIDATRRLRFAGKPPKISFNPVGAAVTVDGDAAELRWTMRSGSDEFVEVVGESYKLRRDEQGWKVYENRFWILEVGPQGNPTKYDSAFYTRADKDAEEASVGGNLQAELDALTRGRRSYDAYLVATKMAATQPTAGLLSRLATLALSIGEVDAARKAACSAKAMDSDAYLPSWAASEPCAM